MCGIAGGVNISDEVLDKMLAVQGSRGPDWTDRERIDRVAFGHNLLAIVDKSEQARQPKVRTDALLSYNGELYNYSPEYKTDTDWVFDLLRDGLDPNKLNGMFALAYYNVGRREIYLIRDRFGIKPLYYTHQKDFFAFASTPAALAATKENWNVSSAGLEEYLALGATTLHSMFAGIDAVPPGHILIYNVVLNETTVARWYYPKFVDNAIEVIKERTLKAIDRVKLACDWPQIILLSGGIDSTLVASRYQNQKAIHLESPEREYAQKVADRFGIKLYNVSPIAESAEECLRDYVTTSGEPTMAGLIPYITCKEIAKLGYRVAVTANGADELFYGYDRMTQGGQRESIFREFDFTDKVLARLTDRLALPNWWSTGGPQWFEIIGYLMFDLNKTLDFASMCHSIEVRVPYLDHELVEAALSLAQGRHVGRYGNKTILKEELVALGFDFGFIHRPKVGFSLHYPPGDLTRLQSKALDWYEKADLPRLKNPTARQEAYFQISIPSLYIWYQIFQQRQ